MFGGSCGQERTQLVIVNGNLTAQRYIVDILRTTSLPFHQQLTRGISITRPDFMQPESCKHVLLWSARCMVVILVFIKLTY